MTSYDVYDGTGYRLTTVMADSKPDAEKAAGSGYYVELTTYENVPVHATMTPPLAGPAPTHVVMDGLVMIPKT